MPSHLLHNTHNLLLRHQQQFLVINDKANDLTKYLLLGISFTILLISAFLFLDKAARSQVLWLIWPLPRISQQQFIYVFLVILLAVIGGLGAVRQSATLGFWIFYAAANILLAGYLYFQQGLDKCRTQITFLVAVLIGVCMQALIVNTHTDKAKQDIKETILRNCLGAVLAWAIIAALLDLGKFLVHGMDFKKKCQAIVFFILAIGTLAFVAYWNKTHYFEWIQMIGFLGFAVILLLICAYESNENSKTDLENLISKL